MERERRCRARARVGWAGVDDGRRPRGCELRPCACREQQSAQEREENGKEETGHVARSPFGARSGLGVGGGVQDPTHSRRGCTPVASAKAVPMRTRRGSRSSARGGTTTGLPLSLQARSRGIPRYNVAGGEVLPRPRSTLRLRFHAQRRCSPDPNGWRRVPTQPPARSWGTGITVNRQLSRDPCPPHGGVRGNLVHEEGEGGPEAIPVVAARPESVSLGERGRRQHIPRSARRSHAPLAARKEPLGYEWASA